MRAYRFLCVFGGVAQAWMQPAAKRTAVDFRQGSQTPQSTCVGRKDSLTACVVLRAALLRCQGTLQNRPVDHTTSSHGTTPARFVIQRFVREEGLDLSVLSAAGSCELVAEREVIALQNKVLLKSLSHIRPCCLNACPARSCCRTR